MKEHVVLLLKGRLPGWQFLWHISASIKLGFSSFFFFHIFFSLKLGKFTYFSIGKGVNYQPQIWPGKIPDNHFDVQTDISQKDKVLFCLWLLVVFQQKMISITDVSDENLIRHPKILNWKKSSIINNNNKMPASKMPASRDHETWARLFKASLA